MKGCKFEPNVPVDISDLDIWVDTPSGREQALAAVIKNDSGLCFAGEFGRFECAKEHILFDETGQQKKARDFAVGDRLMTRDGAKRICSISPSTDEVFYDISVNAPHHSYYDADGVLHHNTWMIAALCDAASKGGHRSIVIVPSSDLVEQTAATFRLGCLDVGIYSGSNKDLNHEVVVATWQALQNNPVVMQDFQCIIVDEAHGASAKVIGDLINNHGKHCAYRFGFTGTFPKPKTDQMTLIGSIGPVLYEISAADLIRMGYLAKLEIEPIEIQETADEEFPDYAAERAFINKNADRLDLIADLVISKADEHGNTLVLVNSIKQGEALQKLIKDSVFLYGATENEVRAEWYHMFENTDNLIVIATFGIASTGISIDRVFNVTMIDAGKSFVKTIQSIGRGLRKANDKDRVHCVDIHSNLKWSKRHFKERKKYYLQAEYPIRKIMKIGA